MDNPQDHRKSKIFNIFQVYREIPKKNVYAFKKIDIPLSSEKS